MNELFAIWQRESNVQRQPGPEKVYPHFEICPRLGYRNAKIVIIYKGNS